MRISVKRLYLAAVLVGGLHAPPARAQAPDSVTENSRKTTPVTGSTRSLVFESRGPESLYLAQDEQKDPMIAGLMSALIPGLGSYYSDNSRHGTIHLGIDIASYALMFGAIGSAASCSTYNCVNSTAATVYVGYLTYLANGVWSIFTAVNDAHDFNGRTSKPGRIVGSLFLRPVDRRDVEGKSSTGTATGLQLQLRF